MTDSNAHRLLHGNTVDLAQLTTSGQGDRDAFEAELKTLGDRMARYQRALYAERQRSLLVVFQAIDGGGKDGTIRKVFSGVNPQGVRVASFKKPTELERQHDFLWRIHQQTPAAGMIAVFNRSHYEDVLVVRVDRIVPESTWRKRFDQINEFEAQLAAAGTTTLKFFLHISPEEQAQRMRDRLRRPEKNWKFSRDDLEKRKQWYDYQQAFQDMLQLCTTETAPWYVIPADRKWYRNTVIARAIVETLETLDPQYPTATEDFSDITIADTIDGGSSDPGRQSRNESP